MNTAKGGRAVDLANINFVEGRRESLIARGPLSINPRGHFRSYKMGDLVIGVRVGHVKLPKTLDRVKRALEIYAGGQAECACKMLADMREEGVIRLIGTNN